MSKKYFDPTIPLQKEIGDQIYNVLHGGTLEFIRHECEGEDMDERTKERRERYDLMIEKSIVPDIYRLCQKAKKALSFKQNIDFYLTSDADINASSIASNEPDKYPHVIKLNAGLVNLMSEKELLFVLGHEIGHIINGDTQLKKLKNFIFKDEEVPDFISQRFALYDLLCELGADRYGFIACGGDEKSSILAFHKLAAGIDLSKMNISLDALIKENKKHLDYFMNSNKSVGSTHPVHPIRIQSLHLYATAKSEKELEEEMAKIEDRFYNLDEEDATFNYFFIAAGYLLSNLDGEASDAQKRTIVYKVGIRSWFPVEFINHVVETENLELLYHNTVKLLVDMNEENKVEMMDYLMDVAFKDGLFSEKELHFIYDFGHEAGWNDEQIAYYISELISQNFIPNVLLSKA